MHYNKVNFTICGKEYSLQTKDNPSYFKDIANRLDERIKTMMDENKNMSMSTAIILISLSLMEEKFKINQDISNVLNQVNRLNVELEDVKFKLSKYESDIN